MCELLGTLPGLVLIERFQWSGKNSPKYRHLAAEQLADTLRVQKRDHPSAKHFVIGHSHGGNIALKAVESAKLFEDIGIVCLSTPFFHVGRRIYGTGAELWAISLGAVILSVLMSIYIFSRLLPDWSNLGPLPGLFWMVVMFPVILVGVRWMHLAETTAARLQLSVPDIAKLLIIRSYGDEAAAGIGAFQFMSMLLTKLVQAHVSFLVMLCCWIDALPGKLLDRLTDRSASLILSCWLAGIALVIAFLPKSGWIISIVVLAMLILPVVAFIWTVQALQILRFAPLLAVGALLPVALAIMACAFLPLGIEGFASALFYEVTVEPAPTGAWMLNQIAPVHPDLPADLMHSTTHFDPNALALLHGWILGNNGQA